MKIAENIFIHDKKSSYQIVENDRVCAAISGVVFLSGSEPVYDPTEIAELLIREALDFNKLHGFFRMVAVDKINSRVLFLGDNSGSQIFYIDTQKNRVSDSLLELSRLRENIEPDYFSIKQFLNCGRIFTSTTIVKDIITSETDEYYCMENGQIRSIKKGLTDFSPVSDRLTLKELMDHLGRAVDMEKTCAVATGGTDSRCILAHLLRRGVRPQLYLTGNKGNPDLSIAQEISKTTKLPIDIIDPSHRETDWLQKGSTMADGNADAVLCYRHYLKAKAAEAAGFRYEFGGVGGEFYKNSFCNPIRNRLYGKTISDEMLYKAFFDKARTVPVWFGEKLSIKNDTEKDKLMALAHKANIGGLLCKYNSAGFLSLKKSFVTITNGYSSYAAKIDPLVDRDVIAGVCGNPVMRQSMQRWQRKEIHNSWPQLSDIPTDQGLSCSLKPLKLLREEFIMLNRYISLAINRIKRYMGLKNRRTSADYWGSDYYEAMQTATYLDAVDSCKKIGLIANDIDPMKLPLAECGSIITIGTVFNKDNKKI